MSKRDFAKGALTDSALDGEAANLMEMAVNSLDAQDVSGLDLRGAIDAHMRWKGRLSRYVAGTSTEVLDAGVVSRDDQCALGKWLYGVGLSRYGGEQLFEDLKAVHARFHASAGQIVAETDKGNREVAQALLDNGDYARTSLDVSVILGQLFVLHKDK